MTSPAERKGIWTTVDARLALHNFLYEVPAYANTLPYVLGAVTLMGLVILVGTGVLLGQFYAPDPEVANQSIRAIMAQVPGGAVIRGIHIWAAHLTVVVLVLHLVRVFVTGAYRYPREANWAIGVALLATMLALFFTGTVLRWDQEGIEALEHNIGFAALVGVFGGWFSPTFSRHVPLLTRLFMAHVSLLPMLMFMLLAGHIYLVRQHGISGPLTGAAPPGTHYNVFPPPQEGSRLRVHHARTGSRTQRRRAPRRGCGAGLRHRGNKATMAVPPAVRPGELVRTPRPVGNRGVLRVAAGCSGPGPRSRSGLGRPAKGAGRRRGGLRIGGRSRNVRMAETAGRASPLSGRRGASPGTPAIELRVTSALGRLPFVSLGALGCWAVCGRD